MRWKLYPCPECGDAARCRCGLEQCGHHGEREAVEVIPADQLAGAVEALVTARAALHSACMFIGSTEGYGEAFARINAAITAAGGQ